jgi:hypothetical protein
MNEQHKEMQETFIELIFMDEYMNDFRKAANVAGYSQKTPISQIMNSVREEVIKKADTLLAMNSPKAVKKVLDVLDNPHKQGAKTQLDAAQSILDRAGIAKRERLEVEVKAPSGLVFLPPKKSD